MIYKYKIYYAKKWCDCKIQFFLFFTNISFIISGEYTDFICEFQYSGNTLTITTLVLE